MKLKKALPYLCSILGIAFAGAAVYTTYKATVKYVEEVPKETRNKPIKSKEDLLDKVKMGVSYYAVPSILFVASGVSIVSSSVLSHKHQKGLAAGYIALDKVYTQYRTINKQINGDAIDDEIYSKMVFDCESNETKNRLKAMRDKNEQLILVKDTYTDNVFEITKESLLIGLLEANRILATEGYLSLNDVYRCMDVPEVPYGYEIGWSIDTFCDNGCPTYFEVGLTKCGAENVDDYYALYYVYDPLPSFMDGWLN